MLTFCLIRAGPGSTILLEEPVIGEVSIVEIIGLASQIPRSWCNGGLLAEDVESVGEVN